MTPDQIRAAIAADPALQAMQADGNCEGIARALTAALPPVALPAEVGVGTVLEVLGLAAGNALLDVLRDPSGDFRHVAPLLEQGRLRLDLPMTAQVLGFLVPAVLTAAQRDGLLARVQTAPAPVIRWEAVKAAIAEQGA